MPFLPAVGDPFTVPGRRDLLTIAQVIARFRADDEAESVYLVQSPAGSRWMLAENTADDGPQGVRWIGRAVPAETNDVITTRQGEHE